ncbi:thioredoxin family protein [Salisaeta longa]|uniref:thioredoxin family protein n=1 Tax=Salisaeta longa TaxID=503170 RepID=UPI0003B770FF|nr:thioredoxin family protein [Salisaeta longa]
MRDFFAARRPHEGFTYDAYRAYWQEQIKQPLPDDADASDRKIKHYLNYNWERQQHVHDAYIPSATLTDALDRLPAPQLWMVLTEPWCGDSAYNLPVIADAAAESPNVSLRILLRDDNLDIMDQYLTGGSRSIPKLVIFSEDGDEHATWGPRPEPARALRERLIAEGTDSQEVVNQLLAHYEDGGWQAVDDELAARLAGVTKPA